MQLTIVSPYFGLLPEKVTYAPTHIAELLPNLDLKAVFEFLPGSRIQAGGWERQLYYCLPTVAMASCAASRNAPRAFHRFRGPRCAFVLHRLIWDFIKKTPKHKKTQTTEIEVWCFGCLVHFREPVLVCIIGSVAEEESPAYNHRQRQYLKGPQSLEPLPQHHHHIPRPKW